MEKSCRKLVPDSFSRLANILKQPLHAKNYFKNKILKENYQKALKKSALFFLQNPVPFNGQIYQKGSGTSDQSLFRLQNKFRKILLLVIYYLTNFNDVI